MVSHLEFAVRALVRTPFVSAVAVLSLALGIGANAAIFSLFDQMLLRPLPVHEPERLVNLAAPGPKPGSQSCNMAGDCNAVFSYPMFRDLEAAGGPFRGLAAHRVFGANLAHATRTVNGIGVLVSGSYFPVLGLQPVLGRLLGAGDDRTVGEHYVAVLSHRFWQQELGGDPGVVDQTLTVNGQPMTIVGVAPAGFDGVTLGVQADVFVPLTMRGTVVPGWEGFDNRRSYWAYVFGRLAPGVTVEQARVGINSVYAGIVRDVEAPLQEGMSAQTLERFRAKQILVEGGRRGQSELHGDARTPLTFLLAITGMVLVIACANIANLLLARGAGRAQEMAVRSSLGATRGQLLRQLLTESVVLAGLGGIASILVAKGTLILLAALLPAEVAAILELELRPRVLLFAGALAVGTGILFGLFPALHSTRRELASSLRSATRGSSSARAASRFRAGLVTAQMGLAMALLVTSGLFIRSLANVARVDLGIETADLVTFAVSPELNGYDAERSRELFARLEEEVGALPGVTGVSASLVPLLAGSSWGTDVAVQGFRGGPDVDQNSRYNEVGPGYFETVGMTLAAGRGFTVSDGEGAPRVAVVNETFAEKFGLGREVVGSFMGLDPDGDPDIEIVGLVRDAGYADVKEPVPPLFFLPWRQNDATGALTFYARVAGDPAEVLRAVPDVVKALDPNLPVEELKTVEQQIRENVFVDRMIGTVSTAFALLATLLAAVGLYGVLAYTVARRTREIGLRMALGADGGRVRGMVLRQVLAMAGVGGVLGIGAALLAGRAAGSLLYDLQGHDPVAVAVGAVLLAAVAVGAGYLPARRASRVDPMDALRYEG